MKRKLLLVISMVITLLAIVVPPTVAAASDGNITIELSDITITSDRDIPLVGDTITISGTAAVTSEAEITNWLALLPQAEAYAEVFVILTDPDSQTAAVYTESDSDCDWGLIGPEDAEATVIYDWSFDYKLLKPGLWSIAQSGYGYYDWEYYYLSWWRLKTANGSDEDFESITKEFWVELYVPEMYFTFLIPMGYDKVRYPNDTTNPESIVKDIECIGEMNGVQYRFVIPAGTVITNGNGNKATYIFIDNIDGTTVHSTFSNMEFSNPVTVYQANGVFHINEYNEYVGGEWIELGSFTEIVNNIATLN